MTKRWWLASVLVSGCVCLIGGCGVAAVGAGAAGVAYLKGDLESFEPYSVEEVYEAGKKAFAAMGIPVFSESRDLGAAKIVGRDTEDRKVTMKITHQASRVSKVSIRVSTFGNEQQSRSVYMMLREYLQ